MSLNISLELELDRSEPYRNRALQVLLWTLIHLNELHIVQHPETPRLYEAARQGRIRYMREPYGYEQWITIPKVLKQGGADCEDLCAWRVAELRVRDRVPARPSWRPRKCQGPDGEFILYHIRVFVPGKGFEDPSALLGMRARGVPVIRYPAHWRYRP